MLRQGTDSFTNNGDHGWETKAPVRYTCQVKKHLEWVGDKEPKVKQRTAQVKHSATGDNYDQVKPSERTAKYKGSSRGDVSEDCTPDLFDPVTTTPVGKWTSVAQVRARRLVSNSVQPEGYSCGCGPTPA